MNNNDRFVNYTCLESLLIEGEEIATEGILSSIFSKKNPDNMSDNEVIAKYLYDNKLLVKSEKEAEENRVQTYIFSTISEKDPRGQALAGIKFTINGYRSPDNELITYWVSTVDAKSGKTKSISIMYSDRKEKNINYNTMLNYVIKNNK